MVDIPSAMDRWPRGIVSPYLRRYYLSLWQAMQRSTWRGIVSSFVDVQPRHDCSDKTSEKISKSSDPVETWQETQETLPCTRRTR